MKRIFTFLSLAALPVLASAQSQRVVLVEHFTQASCGPCAVYNPAFNTLINNNPSTVVSIKYQTSWPGVDPMNAHNPSEVQTRVSYYGVNSVPRAVLDGTYFNGNPNAVNQNHFTNRSAVGAPFTIALTNAVNASGDSINVTAVVTKTGAVDTAATLKLHMGVIERDIYFPVAPGSNGEKHFMSVMKKMLPNASGTTLSAMAIGDVATFSYSWKMANVYDMTQLAAVAFIQNNSTKEVYQAGYSAPNFDLNMNMSVENSVRAKIAGTNGQGNFDLKFKTNYTTNGVYRLKLNKSQLPSGWSAELTVNGQTYSDSTDLNFAPVDSQMVQVKIMSGPNPFEKGVVTLEGFLTTNYSAYRAVHSVTAYSTIRTAFINKGGSNTTYLNSLAAAGTSTVQLSKEDFEGLDPAGLTKANVDHVFISTGMQYTANLLTEGESNNLANYLNSGGNVFITGQDVGYSSNLGASSAAYKNFYTNYLGAQYLHDGEEDDIVAVKSIAGEPIFGSLGITGLGTSSFTLYSDVISPSPASPNATPIMMYTSLDIPTLPDSGVAALRNNGANWKVVYVACLTEAMNSSAIRDNLIDKSIDWFDGIISSTQFDNQISSSMKTYPNPAGAQFTVELAEVSAGSVLNVVDLLGRVVLTENIAAGTSNTVIKTSSLNAGTYFIQVAGSDAPAQKIVIVK